MTSKVGRNDPCPCGSGKKYKQCCMKKEQEQKAAKYTSAGKRKFKAKVLSTGDKTLSVFGRSATTPTEAPAEDTLQKLKYRMTNRDFRAEEETPKSEEPLPFEIPSGEESDKERPSEGKRDLPEEDEMFEPTKEDFQQKE